MMKNIREYGQQNGYIAFMALTSSRLLKRIYLDNGFRLGDSNMEMYLG